MRDTTKRLLMVDSLANSTLHNTQYFIVLMLSINTQYEYHLPPSSPEISSNQGLGMFMYKIIYYFLFEHITYSRWSFGFGWHKNRRFHMVSDEKNCSII